MYTHHVFIGRQGEKVYENALQSTNNHIASHRRARNASACAGISSFAWFGGKLTANVVWLLVGGGDDFDGAGVLVWARLRGWWTCVQKAAWSWWIATNTYSPTPRPVRRSVPAFNINTTQRNATQLFICSSVRRQNAPPQKVMFDNQMAAGRMDAGRRRCVRMRFTVWFFVCGCLCFFFVWDEWRLGWESVIWNDGQVDIRKVAFLSVGGDGGGGGFGWIGE